MDKNRREAGKTMDSTSPAAVADEPLDAAAFRTILEARASQLRSEVRSVSQEEKHSDEVLHADVADEGDIGEARIRDAVRHAEVDRDVDELQRIDRAFARMAAGTYGDCAECGIRIPLARLKAEPAAERCIACQEAFEATHRTGPAIAPALSEPPPRA